ncbi:MAG: hypothetical protein EBU33_01765, partial [Sphingobacteriia bacterium]|nr:hypothetical protein [Sphingobacteriia bacterium]
MPPLNARLRVLLSALVCVTASSVIALLALQNPNDADAPHEQAAVLRVTTVATAPVSTAPAPASTHKSAPAIASAPATYTQENPPIFPDIELIAPTRARMLAENASTSTSTRAQIGEGAQPVEATT